MQLPTPPRRNLGRRGQRPALRQAEPLREGGRWPGCWRAAGRRETARHPHPPVVTNLSQPEMGKRLPRWPKFRPTGRERTATTSKTRRSFHVQSSEKFEGKNCPLQEARRQGLREKWPRTFRTFQVFIKTPARAPEGVRRTLSELCIQKFAKVRGQKLAIARLNSASGYAKVGANLVNF
jgi:hypothetical protein